MREPTDGQIANFYAALECHIDRLSREHRLVFATPVVGTYSVGDVVMLSDHYNTGFVVGYGAIGRTWIVLTWDADGGVVHLTCDPADIRPAPRSVQFRADMQPDCN